MSVLIRFWLVGCMFLLGADVPRALQDAPGEALFEQANDAYRRGAYDQAELRWESLLGDPELSEEDRSRVAMSLGNSAWRSDRKMEAIGWYTLATRADARNADARANLELARIEAGLDPDDRGDLRSTVRRALLFFRPAERRWAVFGSLLLLSLCLLGEALRGSVLWRRIATLAALVFALACVPWLYGMVQKQAASLVVIEKPSVSLRSEPRSGVGATGEVRAGELVSRIDALTGWTRIEASDGKRGWVSDDALFDLNR